MAIRQTISVDPRSNSLHASNQKSIRGPIDWEHLDFKAMYQIQDEEFEKKAHLLKSPD